MIKRLILFIRNITVEKAIAYLSMMLTVFTIIISLAIMPSCVSIYIQSLDNLFSEHPPSRRVR